MEEEERKKGVRKGEKAREGFKEYGWGGSERKRMGRKEEK